MFKENQIESKIIAYDHNWDDTNYAKTIYDDIESASFVSGTGFHCYDGDVKATQTLIDQYPSKDIWFTECSGGLWAPNFSDNLGWNIENVFIGSLNHGAKSVLLWNIALDLESGPKNGGCMNCRGLLTIDPITQQIEKNVEYYLVAHFSKFIQRGANVIESNTINKAILNACFLNPDGSVVCVIYNRLDKTQTIHIVIADDVIEYDLKEKSLVTFKLYPNDCNN
jgi:glucosylceramidase